jgi:hypothetical protein
MVAQSSSLPCTHDAAALDADWHRCRRDARQLMGLELALVISGVGVLVIVALCGIVAIAHITIMTGALGIPLGLGLAVTLALVLLGLSARARVGHELLIDNLKNLDCARRIAEERATFGDSPQPYRTPARSPSGGGFTPCPYCVFEGFRKA